MKKKESAVIFFGKAFAACLVLFVIAAFAFNAITEPHQQAKPYAEQLTPEQKTFLSELHEKEFLDLETQNHRAFVDPLLWFKMNAHEKEDFTATLAIACADQEQSKVGTFIDILDRQSGKKLASWSYLSGFKVE